MYSGRVVGLTSTSVFRYHDKGTRVRVSLRTCRIARGARLLLLPNDVFGYAYTDRSFAISCVIFSSALFERVASHLSPSFFRFLGRRPYVIVPRRHMGPFVKLDLIVGSLCRSESGDFHVRVFGGFVRGFVLSFCSGARRLFLRGGARKVGHRRRVFGHFVRLVRGRYAARHRMSFCTTRLFVAPHCLSAVMRGMSNGATGDVVSQRMVLRVGTLLRSASLDVRRVSGQLSFPSRSFFNHCFGGRANGSPLRCQGQSWGGGDYLRWEGRLFSICVK